MYKNDAWTAYKNIVITYPERPHLKIEELDKIPYYDEHNNVINVKKHERMEQYMANDYVDPDCVVLELGARYGTVSCVINNKLENPRSHVVLEPDKLVIPSLEKNRKSHKSKFTIYNGIISEKKMKLENVGYAARTIDADDNDSNIVQSWALKDIMDETGLSFNTLVADCEGCLCEFVENNSKYIKNYKLIIFEQDYPETCDYLELVNKLLSWNFVCVIDSFIMVWKKSL